MQDLVIVRDFMVEEVATVKPEDSLDDALRLMNQYTIHEMPVVSAADPRHVVALLTRNNLAAAYHQSGEYEKAITDAEKCIEVKPDWSKGYQRKAMALQAQ